MIAGSQSYLTVVVAIYIYVVYGNVWILAFGLGIHHQWVAGTGAFESKIVKRVSGH